MLPAGLCSKGLNKLHVWFDAEWNYGVIRGGGYAVVTMVLIPWLLLLVFGERLGPWVSRHEALGLRIRGNKSYEAGKRSREI